MTRAWLASIGVARAWLASIGVTRAWLASIGVARAWLASIALVAACGRGGGDAIVDDGFDYPVGAPDAVGYHDAQPFGANDHLGEDWNGDGGGDSDLGDPVYAIARGRVTFAEDVGGGWGNVVRIAHRYRGGQVEALFAHLDTIAVAPGQAVLRGQVIGTVGTAGGHYAAHLHLELRRAVGLPLGGGYGRPAGQLAPTPFIAAHRSRH